MTNDFRSVRKAPGDTPYTGRLVTELPLGGSKKQGCVDCHRACLQECGISWHRDKEGEGRRLQAESVPADASAVESLPRTLSSWVPYDSFNIG